MKHRLLLSWVFVFSFVTVPVRSNDVISSYWPALVPALPALAWAYNYFEMKNHPIGKHLPAVAGAAVACVGVYKTWYYYFKKHAWEKDPHIHPRIKQQIRAVLDTGWLKDPAQRFKWLDWLSKYPFGKITPVGDLSLEKARKQLNATHVGLESAKESVLDYVAALKINGGSLPKVICLEGLPGTGKTTLAQSIAKALGKKFITINLSGKNVHDLYLQNGNWDGPGLLARALMDAGCMNPVVLFDEIDKSSEDVLWSMLTLLDPAQNMSITDKYFGMDIDYSNVTVVMTANDLAKLPDPLKQRMHIIRIRPYTLAERMQIATQMIVPDVLRVSKLPEEIKPLLEKLVEPLAYKLLLTEGGVRTLKRGLGIASEKYARILIENNGVLPENLGDGVNVNQVLSLLDPELLNDKLQGNVLQELHPGAVYSIILNEQSGAMVSLIEAAVTPHGKGKLERDESIVDDAWQAQQRAFAHIKKDAALYDIDPNMLAKRNVFFGDHYYGKLCGSTLGLAYAVSLVSALTHRKVRPDVAVTGAIDMHGNVLSKAMHRANVFGCEHPVVKNIIVPKGARAAIEAVKESFPHLTVFYVSTVQEALDLALEPA